VDAIAVAHRSPLPGGAYFEITTEPERREEDRRADPPVQIPTTKKFGQRRVADRHGIERAEATLLYQLTVPEGQPAEALLREPFCERTATLQESDVALVERDLHAGVERHQRDRNPGAKHRSDGFDIVRYIEISEMEPPVLARMKQATRR